MGKSSEGGSGRGSVLSVICLGMGGGGVCVDERQHIVYKVCVGCVNCVCVYVCVCVSLCLHVCICNCMLLPLVFAAAESEEHLPPAEGAKVSL